MLGAFCRFRFLHGCFVSVSVSVFFPSSSSVVSAFPLRFLCIFYSGRPSLASCPAEISWREAESWNMAWWLPRPSRGKFRRLSVGCCNRFVKEARILEYGWRREEGGGWENYAVSKRFLYVFSPFSSSVFFTFSTCVLLPCSA